MSVSSVIFVQTYARERFPFSFVLLIFGPVTERKTAVEI